MQPRRSWRCVWRHLLRCPPRDGPGWQCAARVERGHSCPHHRASRLRRHSLKGGQECPRSHREASARRDGRRLFVVMRRNAVLCFAWPSCKSCAALCTSRARGRRIRLFSGQRVHLALGLPVARIMASSRVHSSMKASGVAGRQVMETRALAGAPTGRPPASISRPPCRRPVRARVPARCRGLHSVPDPG